MKVISRVHTFTKALHIIDSCVTREQLESAQRYVELFEKMFTGGRKEQQMSAVLYLKVKERRRLL